MPEKDEGLLLTPNTFKDFAHRKAMGEWSTDEEFATAVAEAQLAKDKPIIERDAYDKGYAKAVRDNHEIIGNTAKQERERIRG